MAHASLSNMKGLPALCLLGAILLGETFKKASTSILKQCQPTQCPSTSGLLLPPVGDLVGFAHALNALAIPNGSWLAQYYFREASRLRAPTTAEMPLNGGKLV